MTCLSEKETDAYDAVLSSIERLKEVAHNIAGNARDGDDALQELMVWIFEMPEEKLNKIYDGGGLLWYCIRSLSLMLNSKNSRYYYKYRKFYELVDSNIQVGNVRDVSHDNQTAKYKLLQDIDDIVEDLYWYDKELFKLYYYSGNTLHGLAEQTGISRTSIFNTIKRVKEYIKKEINGKVKY